VVKSDDAEVPIHLWDKAVYMTVPSPLQVLSILLLRICFFCIYRKQLGREARSFLAKTCGRTEHPHNKYRKAMLCPSKSTAKESWKGAQATLKQGKGWLAKLFKADHPTTKDAEAMREVIWRAAGNDWFEYPTGSRLHY
jgi:hypothetical protein